MNSLELWIGCAGWVIPKDCAHRFPEQGSHLERYAARLSAVEVNSSFYEWHRPETYARWAASVPEGFRFAVKMSREITHLRRLKDTGLLERFLAETGALGRKLGAYLVQLPPSLAFDPYLAGAFFAALRQHFAGQVACEPRHATWFTPQAQALLADFRVARVAADPAPHALGAEPGGWPGLVYYRLHGSPRMYYSAYTTEYLENLAQRLTEAAAQGAIVWCIFDNTAVGAATANALDLLERLQGVSTPP